MRDVARGQELVLDNVRVELGRWTNGTARGGAITAHGFGGAQSSRVCLLLCVVGGEGVDEFYCFDADADDLADEADDVFLIIRVVGVAGDSGAFVGGDLILVDDPIEGAAVAEAVVEDFGRDFGERQGFVDFQLGLVFGEPHLLDMVGEWDAVGFEPLERPEFELFVAEVEAVR